MAGDRFEIGIVVDKRRLSSPWASHAWQPSTVLAAAPDLPPWTRLRTDAAGESFYAGAIEVTLHPSESAHYRDNLNSGRPAVWVAIRPIGEEVELATATVDPYRGEAMAEAIGEIVEALPMPDPVAAIVAAFIEAHPAVQRFIKRRRDRADPEALARAPSGRGRSGEEP